MARQHGVGRIYIKRASYYRQNCESMQRAHISPALGKRPVGSVTSEDVERLARAMLKHGGRRRRSATR